MPDYEAALRALHQRFVVRLSDNLQMIAELLALPQLSKDDVRRAHNLAHDLAGSGTIFGFPAITAAGQKADMALGPITENAAAAVSAQEVDVVYTVLLELQAACAAALQSVNSA